LEAEGVSLCIVTRGDVPLAPVLEHVPSDWQVVRWDNRERRDMKVYGRFCAVDEAEHETIAFVDDDVAFEHWDELLRQYQLLKATGNEVMVCNDAHGDNPAGLEDVALTAVGSIVSKTLIAETWQRWSEVFLPGERRLLPLAPDGNPGILYACDFVFGILVPHVNIRLPYTNLYANTPGDRLANYSWFQAMKYVYTEMARSIRDGSFRGG
jgi:hypothetical protein